MLEPTDRRFELLFLEPLIDEKKTDARPFQASAFPVKVFGRNEVVPVLGKKQELAALFLQTKQAPVLLFLSA